MTRANGIDVSIYHPVKDWGALVASGVSFVGFKATEGLHFVDKTLIAHRDAFRAHPFLLGVYYHFARPGDPVAQAKHLLDTVGSLEAHERLALDFETLTTDAAHGLAWIDSFMGALKVAYPDRRHLIYTSKRIWDLIGNPAWAGAADVDLWVPRYSTEEPKLPAPWSRFTFWQFTDGVSPVPRSVPGVGQCDASYFNGELADLAEYAQLVTG